MINFVIMMLVFIRCKEQLGFQPTCMNIIESKI